MQAPTRLLPSRFQTARKIPHVIGMRLCHRRNRRRMFLYIAIHKRAKLHLQMGISMKVPKTTPHAEPRRRGLRKNFSVYPVNLLQHRLSSFPISRIRIMMPLLPQFPAESLFVDLPSGASKIDMQPTISTAPRKMIAA